MVAGGGWLVGRTMASPPLLPHAALELSVRCVASHQMGGDSPFPAVLYSFPFTPGLDAPCLKADARVLPGISSHAALVMDICLDHGPSTRPSLPCPRWNLQFPLERYPILVFPGELWFLGIICQCNCCGVTCNRNTRQISRRGCCRHWRHSNCCVC